MAARVRAAPLVAQRRAGLRRQPEELPHDPFDAIPAEAPVALLTNKGVSGALSRSQSRSHCCALTLSLQPGCPFCAASAAAPDMPRRGPNENQVGDIQTDGFGDPKAGLLATRSTVRSRRFDPWRLARCRQHRCGLGVIESDRKQLDLP